MPSTGSGPHFLFVLPQNAPQSRACLMQVPARGAGRNLEQLGCFHCAVFLQLDQLDQPSLARWQLRHGGPHAAGKLRPGGLIEGRVRAIGNRVRHRAGLARTFAIACVQSFSDYDPADPGRKRTRRIERSDGAERSQEGVLHHIFRILPVLNDAIGDDKGPSSMAPEQLAEGSLIAGLRAHYEPGFRA